MSKKFIFMIGCVLAVRCNYSSIADFAARGFSSVAGKIAKSVDPSAIKSGVSTAYNSVSSAALATKTSASSLSRRAGVRGGKDEYYLPGSERQTIKIQDIAKVGDINKKRGFYKTPEGKICLYEPSFSRDDNFEILNIAYDPAKEAICMQDVTHRKMMPIYSSDKPGLPMSLIAAIGTNYHLLYVSDVGTEFNDNYRHFRYDLTWDDLNILNEIFQTKKVTKNLSKFSVQLKCKLDLSYYLVLTNI